MSWTCFLSLNPLKKQEITDKKVAKRTPFRKWFLQNSFVNNGRSRKATKRSVLKF